MKVRVSFTLDIDAEAWSYEFGIEKEGVREDVQVYFEELAESQLRDVLDLAAMREP